MSSSNPSWDWLFQFCLEKKLRFIPSSDGEPWVEYGVVAALLQLEPRTIERKVQGLPKHPRFAGLVKLSSFDSEE